MSARKAVTTNEQFLRPGRGSESQAVGAPASAAITLLVIPAPPSTNNLFKNVRGVGRVKTPMYDAWVSECAWRLRAQNAPKIAGSVLVLVGVERTNLRADIDNRIKALFDLLVTQEVIEDDSKIVGFAAAWSPARDGLARVAIMPASSLDVHFQLATDGRHGGWFLSAPQSEEGEA